MSIFLAAPTSTPSAPPVPSAWAGMRMTWTGWDGSVWDLLDRDSGVRLTDGGTRGLAMPPMDRFTSSSASVAGSRHRGSRTVEREVFWPLLVFADSGSQEWIDYDAAFWRTMQAPGVWTVTQPDGRSRSLTCRFAGDGDPSFRVLPAFDGWATYGVTLVAEQPYWSGTPVVRGPWATDSTPGDFPNYIASGSTLANAVMDNPGDVDAWPVYTIEGPSTSVTVGLDGHLITAPIALLEGESLTITTGPGPRGKSAYDNTGARRTPELTARQWWPVPPGQSVPLALSMTGTGSVTATLTPLYHRAW